MFSSYKTLRWLKPFLLIFLGIALSGCQPWQMNRISDQILPSNQRDWNPGLSVLPQFNRDNEKGTLTNIRRCDYLTSDDYVVRHYDRTFTITEIQSLDFIVAPSNDRPAICHAMLSFGLQDGTYLCVSIEGRTEKDEIYSPLLSLGRQYEITYVVGDEQDLIGARALHRDLEIQIFPTIASPEQSQRVFLDLMDRVNQLRFTPEFYDPIQNSNRSNLKRHLSLLQPVANKPSWQTFSLGFSPRQAYEQGLLENRVSFETLESLANVTSLARQYYDAPDFSKRIREPQETVKRLAAHQQLRDDRNRSQESPTSGPATQRRPPARW